MGTTMVAESWEGRPCAVQIEICVSVFLFCCFSAAGCLNRAEPNLADGAAPPLRAAKTRLTMRETAANIGVLSCFADC